MVNTLRFHNGLSKSQRWRLVLLPVGCLLFIVMFLLQGPFRGAYSPLKFAVSSLSIGEYGWIQRANFMISGMLIFFGAFGFKAATPLLQQRVWIIRLMALSGVGLMGAGIFSSDAVYGYPLNEPLALAQFTWRGHLHDLFSMLFFIGLPVTLFKMHHRFRSAKSVFWAKYTLVSAIAMLAFFVLAAMGFKQIPGLVNLAGLFQRLSIMAGLLWMAALSFLVLKRTSE